MQPLFIEIILQNAKNKTLSIVMLNSSYLERMLNFMIMKSTDMLAFILAMELCALGTDEHKAPSRRVIRKVRLE